MRIANLRGRLTVLTEHGGIDVQTASNGVFAAEPQSVFAEWPAFRAWAAGLRAAATVAVVDAELGSPAPAPTQVFGIGLNYRDHAAESGLPVPDRPAAFTKFPTCLTGPCADVELPTAMVDWEVELVVVIGIRAFRVGEAAAVSTSPGCRKRGGWRDAPLPAGVPVKITSPGTIEGIGSLRNRCIAAAAQR